MAGRGRDSITPSVFDRLTAVSDQPTLRWSREDLRDALIRDLQWLLDTRNWVLHERVAEMSRPEDSVSLAGSLAGYGLPDFTVPLDREDKEEGPVDSGEFFRAALELAISEFEPRLEGVNILDVTPEQGARKLYFEVRAALRQPASAPIVLQAVLNLYDGEYTLKEE